MNRKVFPQTFRFSVLVEIKRAVVIHPRVHYILIKVYLLLTITLAGLPKVMVKFQDRVLLSRVVAVPTRVGICDRYGRGHSLLSLSIVFVFLGEFVCQPGVVGFHTAIRGRFPEVEHDGHYFLIAKIVDKQVVTFERVVDGLEVGCQEEPVGG